MKQKLILEQKPARTEKVKKIAETEEIDQELYASLVRGLEDLKAGRFRRVR